MNDPTRRWTILGVSARTRQNVTMYAELRGMTIAQVLDEACIVLEARLAVIRRYRQPGGWYATDETVVKISDDLTRLEAPSEVAAANTQVRPRGSRARRAPEQ